MKPILVSLFALLAVGACGEGSPSEPTGASPTAVPAGIGDPAWAATSSGCVAESPVRMMTAAQRGSMTPFVHGPFSSSDDEWAALARSSPGGIGGVFVESGAAVVFLTDVSKRDAALAAIKSSSVAPFGIDLNSSVARAGRWNFNQLAEWFRLLTPQMESLGKNFSADIQEARNRIEYSVPTAADRAAFEAKLKQSDIPCFLVAIKVLQ